MSNALFIQKPEAIRLAEALELRGLLGTTAHDAAAELRRLHAAHDWQRRMAGERLRRIEKLQTQRDGLVNILAQLVQACEDEGVRGMNILLSAAHAAMHAVQEESAWN